MSMRIRAILISSAVATTAALGMAGGASAATLFTTSAHTTAVATGTTAGATNTTPVVLTSATSTLNTCNTSTLSLILDTNSGGTVTGRITSGSFTGCAPLPATGLFSTPWQLHVSGSATVSGGITTWSNASVTNVGFSLGGGSYSGSLTTGVSAQQTHTGGVCLVFNDAGQLSGPLTTNGRIDTRYCFEGTAASYSLG
jgi:hypothetical protein